MSAESNTSNFALSEELSAYFDGELDAAAEAAMEAELEANPSLAEQLGDLSFMREIVAGDLELQAERVPEARFEQIWDSFERSLERESRLQEAAEAPPNLWERLLEWARPLRVPLAVVGTAAVVALVFAKSIQAPEPDQGPDAVASNTPEDAASDQPAADEASTPESEAPSLSTPSKAPQMAVAPNPDTKAEPEMFPQPEPGEAEIRHISFGGRTGTISQVEGTRGTTTVIWVTEDVPAQSERSL
ncbi:hypothetical protein PPSIR1_12908 [Plesiocystis pacifica SIR-1]|uniref:Zinc-finger domain-containing protein n=1 Tax=Plesiocystis pacifica SIR-1 TaxID=391625 RepID=A6G086_9BACT|nr:hypothetical protein [Plesiocystis pacifica]EDM80783.1 hypothetical protein PPSIR1_12908 [Plesiocystis pacifica SIR-1]